MSEETQYGDDALKDADVDCVYWPLCGTGTARRP
jgi:hypothetical protein